MSEATKISLMSWTNTYCNKAGFNVLSISIHSKARISIIANNENHCFSCDSRIGYGTGGFEDDSNTCGNEAEFSPDHGNKHIKAIRYILVQLFTTNLTILLTAKQEFYMVPECKIF